MTRTADERYICEFFSIDLELRKPLIVLEVSTPMALQHTTGELSLCSTC